MSFAGQGVADGVGRFFNATPPPNPLRGNLPNICCTTSIFEVNAHLSDMEAASSAKLLKLQK